MAQPIFELEASEVCGSAQRPYTSKNQHACHALVLDRVGELNGNS